MTKSQFLHQQAKIDLEISIFVRINLNFKNRIYFQHVLLKSKKQKKTKSEVNFGDQGSGPYYLLGFITFRYPIPFWNETRIKLNKFF